MSDRHGGKVHVAAPAIGARQSCMRCFETILDFGVMGDDRVVEAVPRFFVPGALVRVTATGAELVDEIVEANEAACWKS